MSASKIAEPQWRKIYAFLKAHPHVYAGKQAACRCFVEGVHWILRTGAQWRELPERHGPWNSVYQRFARWEEKGVWAAMHQEFAQDPDMQSVMLDSTVIRAHMCAAGGSKKHGGQAEQALGRSRGGFGTKVHVLIDSLGNPLRFILTGGQRHDVTQAGTLIDSFQFDSLIADTGYDANWLLDLLEDCGAQTVIPPRSNRTDPHEYDRHLYQECHLVECFINQIKGYRRIFTRFEKLAQRYSEFLHFVGALIWLRRNVNGT